MAAVYLPPYYANLTLPTKHKENKVYDKFEDIRTFLIMAIFMSVVSKISCAKN